jgi:predicted porin
MRKLLLATVAVLGASIGVASVADAQTASPAPGTVTVRLNGRFRFYAYGAFDKDVDNNTAGSTAGNSTTALTGSNKQTNFGFAEYTRLYPGFDGVAANGLKYGASVEVRQDNSAGAGGGAFGGVSGRNNSRGALYLRREWGYLGTDQLGTVRLGSTDQPSSLYMTGNFENFDSGGINGDVPGISGNALMNWPFADVGGYYTTNKAIYLSPQLYGFDFGVSFEPSTANVNVGSGCGTGTVGSNTQSISGPGCDRLASSPFNSEAARRKNTFDGLIRYRGSFGGFGVAATAGYMGGSHVADNSAFAYNNDPRTVQATNPTKYNYDGISVGDFGVALTYAGFSVGGKYQFGRFNGQGINPVPKGAADGEAALVGASYTFGPMVVGAHALYYKSAGDLTNAVFGRVRTERGIAAGGTYSLAPGVSLFLSYLWNERKQNGYNFVTGQGVTAAAPGGNAGSNKIQAQLIYFGTAFSW